MTFYPVISPLSNGPEYVVETIKDTKNWKDRESDE